MRPFLRLVWKEARELLRPRYLLPILMVPLIFIAMGQGFGGFQDQLGEQPTIGLVNNDDGEYGAIVEETLNARAEVVYSGTGTDPETALTRTVEDDGSTVVVIPDGFTERIRNNERGTVKLYTEVESVSLTGMASSAQVEDVLSAAGHNVTIAATGASEAELDPVSKEYTTYVKGTQLDSSPASISAAFTSQFIFVPIIIMLAILFSGQMVMNSMASETENKTLETLLSMPISRHKIVAAKLVGGSVIGLFATALYTGGLAFSQVSFGPTGIQTTMSLSGLDYALIGTSLFFSLVGALALALSLGIFADNQQGAQMLLLPMMLLVFVPMFATMFTDFDTLGIAAKAGLFLIPFTHPIIAPKRLLFGDVGLVLAGIGYEVVFALAAVYLAVKLFESDRPITGNAGWLDRVIELFQQ